MGRQRIGVVVVLALAVLGAGLLLRDGTAPRRPPDSQPGIDPSSALGAAAPETVGTAVLSAAGPAPVPVTGVEDVAVLVTDLEGAPIAGALVASAGLPVADAGALRVGELGARQADAAGRATVPAVPGRDRIVASAPGCVPRGIVACRADAAHPLVLALERRGMREVFVEGEDGRPVVGALVRLYGQGVAGTGRLASRREALDPQVRGITGEDGVARLVRGPFPPETDAMAVDPGPGPDGPRAPRRWGRAKLGPGDARTVVRVAPVRGVRLLVEGPEGAAVPDARVVLGIGEWIAFDGPVAVLDADTLAWVAPLYVTVSAPGLSSVTLWPGELEGKDEVRVRLRRAGSVEVRVIDEADRPVAGTTVALWDMLRRGASPWSVGAAGADGVVRLSIPFDPSDPNIRGNTAFAVIGSAPGFAETALPMFGWEQARTPIVLRLARARAIVVAVHDAKGRPVASADVSVLPLKSLAGAWVWTAPGVLERNPVSTDAEGLVRVEGLRVDANLDVRAYTLRRGAAQAEVPPGPDDVRVELTLSLRDPVEVAVRDEQRRPLEGAIVTPAGFSSLGFESDGCARLAVTTDRAGIGRLVGLPSGKGSLTVAAAGHFARLVELSAEASRAEVVLARRASIAGRVVGVPTLEPGQPPLEITAVSKGRNAPYDAWGGYAPLRCPVAPDGSFELEGLIDGESYVVFVEGLTEGKGPWGPEVKAPASGVEVRVPNLRWLATTVVVRGLDVEVAVVAPLYVWLDGVTPDGADRHVSRQLLVRADKPRVPLSLPAGRWLVRANTSNALDEYQIVDLREDGQELVVELPMGKTFDVRVRDRDGKAVPHVTVGLVALPIARWEQGGATQEIPRGSMAATTDAEGVARLRAPARGPIRLRLDADALPDGIAAGFMDLGELADVPTAPLDVTWTPRPYDRSGGSGSGSGR